MKAKKMIAKMQALLGGNSRELAKQAEEIENLLRGLEAKESHFRVKMEAAQSEKEHEKFQRKAEVCSAQRQKGEEALRAIREQQSTP